MSTKTTVVIVHTCKYGQQWVFAFDDNEQQRKLVLRQLGMFAANGELTFDWFDAGVVSKLIRSDAHLQRKKGINDGQSNS